MKTKTRILILLLIGAISSAACGYSSAGNEAIGQVKKVSKMTPLLCPNYTKADVSLGVMQNGVGSMSTQDVWVVVSDKDLPKFQQAVETGKIVKVHYDVARVSLCTENDFATSIEFQN